MTKLSNDWVTCQSICFHVIIPLGSLACVDVNQKIKTKQESAFLGLDWLNWATGMNVNRTNRWRQTQQQKRVLPVRPAAGGGAGSESGVVDVAPGCAWTGPGRSRRRPGHWWVPRCPEPRAGWTKLLACQRGNPASQTTVGGNRDRYFAWGKPFFDLANDEFPASTCLVRSEYSSEDFWSVITCVFV